MTDPAIIVSTAKPGSSVVGWCLDFSSRSGLLERFKPRYARTVADHVTLAAQVASSTPLPDKVRAAVVGRTDDGKGVEALVVAIEGATDRPGGGIYHLTWSLAPDRAAKESNDVLRVHGWTVIDTPMPIRLIPNHIR